MAQCVHRWDVVTTLVQHAWEGDLVGHAHRDADVPRVRDRAVADRPAVAVLHADRALLERVDVAPLRRDVTDVEAVDDDVLQPCPLGKEAGRPGVDLGQVLVWIDVAEVRPDRDLPVRVPARAGELRLVAVAEPRVDVPRVRRRPQIPCLHRLPQRLAVAVDVAEPIPAPAVEPLARDRHREWVVALEERGLQFDHPDATTLVDPGGDPFAAAHRDLLTRRGEIRDRFRRRRAAARWHDLFAVDARLHENRVPGLREVCPGLDGPQRIGRGPRVLVRRVDRTVVHYVGLAGGSLRSAGHRATGQDDGARESGQHARAAGRIETDPAIGAILERRS